MKTLLTNLIMVAFAQGAAAPELPPVVPVQPIVIQAEVSAYSSSLDETDSTPDITASGTKTHTGTAACPIRYDFGTVLEIEGKRYVCEDRMHPRYQAGNYFDIWAPSKSAALQWGRRQVLVTIPNEPKQNIPHRTSDKTD